MLSILVCCRVVSLTERFLAKTSVHQSINISADTHAGLTVCYACGSDGPISPLRYSW
jgi:hypothetical protein